MKIFGEIVLRIRKTSLICIAAAIGLTGSAANATLIFDPSTRTYVEYKQRYSKNRKVPGRYKRKIVRYSTREKKGTIIIDTRRHFLYYVLGRARRSAMAWVSAVPVSAGRA